MQLIDGNAVAQAIIRELTVSVSRLDGRRPKVVFIRVGEDPASVAYVNKKAKVAADIGIESAVIALPQSTSKAELFHHIDVLNTDASVDGILVQAPLPEGISQNETFNRISPDKDVDGFHSVNIGKLCQEDETGFVSCTPAGIVELLRRSHTDVEGRHVVVVGRSLIVGKPLALLLSRRGKMGNATVTISHSRTRDLEAITRQADILIAAIGRPRFITASGVKPDAVVIDVGINRIPNASRPSGYQLVGDVDFDAVAPQCAKITPVPGGVGPMTVAMLMRNTMKAYLKHR